MSEIKLTIHPFEMGTEKEAANKVQEEANEAVHAWRSLVEDEKMNASIRRHVRLADEIADVIQAACNLAVRYGIDLQAAMWRCERRNRERGRYEDEDAESCGVHDGHDCNCGGSCGDASLGVGVLRPKSPEEMSVEELIEALYIANGGSYYRNNSCSCAINFDHDWCKGHGTCTSCRERLLDLLKAAHKREIADLTHERDGLRNRLAELDEAGITSLHRLLREAMGEAKNITHNARVYIDEQKGSNNELCGTDSGRDSCVCGAERARERVLSAEPPAQEVSEREKVVERLRKLRSTHILLHDIGCAVLGKEPTPVWKIENSVAMRDKLIELIGEGGAE